MKNYRAELTGVFGDPVDDNPTGVVEEAAFAAKNLNYRYLTIKVLPEDLGKAMDSVKIFGMKGINLTMPHKIKVLPYLDELSPAAEIIGAVNTVIQKEGKLFGENTDGKGFVTALKNSGETLDKKNVTILGAGGAAGPDLRGGCNTGLRRRGRSEYEIAFPVSAWYSRSFHAADPTGYNLSYNR